MVYRQGLHRMLCYGLPYIIMCDTSSWAGFVLPSSDRHVAGVGGSGLQD